VSDTGLAIVPRWSQYIAGGGVSSSKWEKNQMRSKSEIAWETAAKCAALAQEADDPEEREHYARLRDAWTTLAKRCEPFNFPDVTA
jgi:hypothetical protein